MPKELRKKINIKRGELGDVLTLKELPSYEKGKSETKKSNLLNKIFSSSESTIVELYC